jgi:hypothetical protein
MACDFKKIFLTEEAINSYKQQGLEPAYGVVCG